MISVPSGLDTLTGKVIGCAIEVHRTLGPGLLESVYRECMLVELRREKLRAEIERRVPIEYRGQRIASDLKVDLLVEGAIVVELRQWNGLTPSTWLR